MNLATYYISLNIHGQGAQTGLSLRRGDTARQLCLTLTEGGEAYPIAPGSYAIFTARKPDGTLVAEDCELRKNRIYYPVSAQTVAVPGRVSCQVRLYSPEGLLLTAPELELTVHETVVADDLESATQLPALDRLVAETRQAISDLTEARESGQFKGDQGEKGDIGPQGEKGEKGDRGEKGEKGDPGDEIVREAILALCPEFTQSGPMVTCRPMTDAPLGVTQLLPVTRTGEGIPSRENIREFVPATALTLTHTGEGAQLTYTADLGEAVYGGSLDWTTGVLTVEYAVKVFDGTSPYGKFASSDPGALTYAYTSTYPIGLEPKPFGKVYVNCARYTTMSGPQGLGLVVTIDQQYTGTVSGDDRDKVAEKFNATAAAWYEAGTPLVAVYELNTPRKVQLTPTGIRGLSGENALESSTGELTVTGAAHPAPLLAKLL